MATSLTGLGIVWATLSLAAALLCCTGFYLPFWIQGRLLGRVDAYFSSFRRCNYPRVNPQGVVEIVEECGRYSRFWDIPSPWWQASTILVGTGSALCLLIAVTATAACCITYVIHSGNAKIAGSAQLLSALLVIGGAAVYPVGWDNREFLRISGESRLVSDLSVQRRHVTEQRIALRLANQVPPSAKRSNDCVAETPSTSNNQLPLKTVHVDIENVPLSPALGVANISDAVKSLPKCLMHADGDVFD